MSQAILSGEDKRTLLAELLTQKAEQEGSCCPLSRGQEALWFIHQLASESAAYNLMYAWRIRLALQVPALHRAGQALVMRHPTLRTVYEMSDGRPVQRTLKQQEVAFEVTDANNWSEEQLGERVAEAAHRPFNLQQDCMLRLGLYTRGVHEYVLLLTVHHIAIDFTSIVRLVEELFEIYGATTEGVGAELPVVVERPFSHYVRWQMKLLDGAEGERLWLAWKENLAGELPVLNLPTDRPRPAIQTYSGAVHHFQLSETLSRGLRDFAKSEGLTLYIVLLAVFQILIFRYTGQEDILVGSPFDNRSRAEFKNVIGYFVNPVLLRARPAGKLTCREFLQQVRQTVVWAFDHQDYPFPLLVEKLQRPRDPSRSPLCDVMFILQKPAGSSPLKRGPERLPR